MLEHMDPLEAFLAVATLIGFGFAFVTTVGSQGDA